MPHILPLTVDLKGILEYYVHYHGANTAQKLFEDKIILDFDKKPVAVLKEIEDLLTELIPDWEDRPWQSQ